MNKNNISETINEISNLIDDLKFKLEYNNIVTEIKKNEELKYLFEDDYDKAYSCGNDYISTGFTHLHKCVLMTKKYPKLLEKYIELFINIYPGELFIKNNMGWTALGLACVNVDKFSTFNIVNLLINKGSDVNSINEYGISIFDETICSLEEQSDVEIIKFLLSSGVNVNYKNCYDETPLLKAIESKNINIIKLLLDYGAEITSEVIDDALYDNDILIVELLAKYIKNFDIKIGNENLIKILYREDYPDDIILHAFKNGSKFEDILSGRKKAIYKYLFKNK